MPTVTLECHDDAERLLLEQALAYSAQVRRAAAGAKRKAVEQLVNLRLETTGAAKWLPEHVGPLVELAAFAESPEWHDHWCAA